MVGMDHSEAVQGQAVERYLLGQMSEAESESFEKHFFECAECAKELEMGAAFEENVRAVLGRAAPARVEPARGRERARPWWRMPLFAAPALAALALGAVLILQTNRTAAPEALVTFALRPATRGAQTEITVPGGVKYFAVDVDPPEGSFSAYRCDIASDRGGFHYSLKEPAPAAGRPLSVLLPVAGMTSGSYTLSVFGEQGSGEGPEIGRYPFVLSISN